MLGFLKIKSYYEKSLLKLKQQSVNAIGLFKMSEEFKNKIKQYELTNTSISQDNTQLTQSISQLKTNQ